MDTQIDITQDFTMDKLRNLIASRNDNRDRQLRVSHDGIVYMEDNPHHVDLSDTYFALDVWNEGEGCGGEKFPVMQFG